MARVPGNLYLQVNIFKDVAVWFAIYSSPLELRIVQKLELKIDLILVLNGQLVVAQLFAIFKFSKNLKHIDVDAFRSLGVLPLDNVYYINNIDGKVTFLTFCIKKAPLQKVRQPHGDS